MELNIQLYTLREIFKTQSTDTVMKKIKSIGYTGVQSFGGKENLIEFAEGANRAGLKVIGHLADLDTYVSMGDEIFNLCKKYGIDMISLITPTSQERVTMIAKEAEGFVYCVSSLGVTGVRTEIKTDISEMISLVKDATDAPCAVGFGIAVPEQAVEMAKVADGVIVGSAIVKIIAEHGKNSEKPVADYVKKMKDAIKML